MNPDMSDDQTSSAADDPVQDAINQLEAQGIVSPFSGLEGLVQFIIDQGEDPVSTLSYVAQEAQSAGEDATTAISTLAQGVRENGLSPFACQSYQQVTNPLLAGLECNSQVAAQIASLHQETLRDVESIIAGLCNGETSSGLALQGDIATAVQEQFQTTSTNISNLVAPFDANGGQGQQTVASLNLSYENEISEANIAGLGFQPMMAAGAIGGTAVATDTSLFAGATAGLGISEALAMLGAAALEVLPPVLIITGVVLVGYGVYRLIDSIPEPPSSSDDPNTPSGPSEPPEPPRIPPWLLKYGPLATALAPVLGKAISQLTPEELETMENTLCEMEGWTQAEAQQFINELQASEAEAGDLEVETVLQLVRDKFTNPSQIDSLLEEFHPDTLNQIMENYGSKDADGMFNALYKCKDIPGIQQLADDIASDSGSTAQGAVWELQQASQIANRLGTSAIEKVEIEPLAADGQRGVDIVTDNEIIDTKSYQWFKYKDSQMLDNVADGFVQQIQRFKEMYPGKPIVFSFDPNFGPVPQQVANAITSNGATIATN